MKFWRLWLIAGIISVIGGFAALANPLVATLTADLIAGWIFIVVGGLTLLTALGDRELGGRDFAILSGFVILLIGVALISHPLSEVMSLVIVIASMLVALGVIRLLLAPGATTGPLRWIIILSGALSLFLGILIFAKFPESAGYMLGLCMAIELISTGVSLIVLSLARRSGPAGQLRG